MPEKIKELLVLLKSAKAINLIVLLFIVAAIPLTVFIAQKQQEIRQRASSASPSIFSKAAKFASGEFYISTEKSRSQNFGLLNPKGPMTLEAWIRIDEPIASEGSYLIYKLADYNYPTGKTTSAIYYLQYYQNQFRVLITDTDKNLKGFSTADMSQQDVVGVWNHVAGVYDGQKVRIFVNGVEKGSGTMEQSYPLLDDSLPFYIASSPYLSAKKTIPVTLDEVRISNIARYTSNFSLAILPFVSDLNTSLLWHLDGSELGDFETVKDSSGKGNDGIVTGNTPTDKTNIQFVDSTIVILTPTPTVSQSESNKAVYLGDDSYIKVVDNNQKLAVTRDFTIEAWVKPQVGTGPQAILGRLSTTYGRRYLFDTDKNYDLIFADAYSTIYSIPVHMTTEEFFQLAYSKLNDNGIILANIIGDLGRSNRSLIFSEIKTFKEVFPNSYFFAVEDPGLTSPQNIIFVGYKGSNEVDFGSKNIKANKDEIIANLDSKLIDLKRFNLSNYSILTDNYSPIETLAAQVLKSNYQDRTSGIDSGQVFNLISQMVGYGSRYLGSKAHTKVTEMLAGEMKVLSDEVIAQRWNFKGRGDEYQLVNIIGRINPDAKKRVILATHYDSKKFAILDRENSDKPVPGANDSASGVALLLEIARFIGLNRKNFDLGYDFVFFDGEEGDPNGTTSEWKPLGSNFFSDNIKSLYPDKLPEVAMVADMVCDKNFNIYMEKYSEAIGNPYASKFFDLAAKLYPQNFSKTVNVSIKDDHIPLAKAGIPAFLLIDFDYPYFHTTQDTLDKCSEESLGKLGNSILEFLKTLN